MLNVKFMKCYEKIKIVIHNGMWARLYKNVPFGLSWCHTMHAQPSPSKIRFHTKRSVPGPSVIS